MRAIALTALLALTLCGPAALAESADRPAEAGERKPLVGPRLKESGPPAASSEAYTDPADVLDPARPAGRTEPPPDARSATGAAQATSPTGPMVLPAPTEPAAPEDMRVGVDPRCNALTDPHRRELCLAGSVAGQTNLPPTPKP